MSSAAEFLAKKKLIGPTSSTLYRVYGLVVESELDFPELLPVRNAVPDIRIVIGKVPAAVQEPIVTAEWCQASKREFLMDVEGIARYHVKDGKEITVEYLPCGKNVVRAADVRLWLLGTAFGALLHQRGMLPLHVSAVHAPTGVWAFTGPSGEGKSTLAGFLHWRFGWRLVSDDVSAVAAGQSGVTVYPGPQKLKLWADALEYLDFPGCRKVQDLSHTEKFQLYIPGDQGHRYESLRGLVLLESASDGATPSIKELKGAEAFSVCMESIYRPYMGIWFKQPEQLLHDMAQLSKRVRIFRYSRPRSLANMEKSLAPLLKLLMNGDPDDPA